MAPIELASYPTILQQIHLYSDGGIDLSKDGQYLTVCARLQSPPDWLSSPPLSSAMHTAFSPMSTTDGMDESLGSNVFHRLSSGLQPTTQLSWRTPPAQSLSQSSQTSQPPQIRLNMSQTMDVSTEDSSHAMEWKPISHLPNFASTFPNIQNDENARKKHPLSDSYLNSLESPISMKKSSMDVVENVQPYSAVNKERISWADPHWASKLYKVDDYFNPCGSQPCHKILNAMLCNSTQPSNAG